MKITIKINGLPLEIDSDKMHESWIEKCLAYGMRRLPNDTHSSEKGKDKYDAVVLMIKDMESGEEAPERVASGKLSPANASEALAWKNAKGDLTAMFRQVTGATKALDFAKHEKIAPFFTVTEDRAVWKDESVKAWIGKQKEAGKKDYLADATATIEASATLDLEI